MTNPTPEPPAPTPNVSETPRTDAVFYAFEDIHRGNPVVRSDFARQLERELTAVKKERDTLRDWKESALSVLNEINFQEIGKALGLDLGLSVPKNVLPNIHALQEKLAMAMIERYEARVRADEMRSERDHAEANMDAALARAEKAEEDTRRLDWLERKHVSCKWDDGLPFVRPRHPKHCYAISEYIGVDGWTIRAAIDAALTPTKEPTP